MNEFTRERIEDVAEGVTELCEGVAACVAEVLAIDPNTVFAGSTLLSLGAESFDFVALVFALERKYAIGLPSRYSTPNDQTVDDYVSAVRARMKAI